jgi:hypothetical protein
MFTIDGTRSTVDDCGCSTLAKQFRRLRLIWADGAYAGGVCCGVCSDILK